MRVSARRRSVLFSAGLLIAVAAAPVGAQQSSTATAASKPAALTLAEIRALAEAQIAIAAVLDSNGAQLAKVKNKTLEAQAEMQKRRRELIEQALTKRGLTSAEFERRRYVVSTDRMMRFQLDSMVAKMTGQPLPGTVILAAGGPPGAGAAAASAAPAAAPFPTIVGIMIGYIGGGYLDTPDKAGLLPTAVTEAKIAAQHAGFMARSPDSLRILQMHAGHVLHAIDPTTMPAAKAPGKGYGVKRAVQGAIVYAEQAAREVGASANVKTHSAHIVGAARTTLERADQVIALARKIQSSTDAKAAASLIGELQSLCDQLVAGVDVNADGKIVWSGGEGGIQQAQDHVTLLINGEKKP